MRELCAEKNGTCVQMRVRRNERAMYSRKEVLWRGRLCCKLNILCSLFVNFKLSTRTILRAASSILSAINDTSLTTQQRYNYSFLTTSRIT